MPSPAIWPSAPRRTVGRTIAYCRVSARDQNPELQLDALHTHGYDRQFAEKESGKRGVERPEFTTALSVLEAGDTLVLWKSDRWGRSAAHVLTTINELRDRGVTVKSLTENFDLDTKEGRFMFAVLAAAAEYELELRAERQAEGDRGRQAPPGRRPDAARQETHRPPESDRAGRDHHTPPPRRRRHLRHPGRPHPENLPLRRLRRARQHTLTHKQPQARITETVLPQVRDIRPEFPQDYRDPYYTYLVATRGGRSASQAASASRSLGCTGTIRDSCPCRPGGSRPCGRSGARRRHPGRVISGADWSWKHRYGLSLICGTWARRAACRRHAERARSARASGRPGEGMPRQSRGCRHSEVLLCGADGSPTRPIA
jgi:hypothetical protein